MISRYTNLRCLGSSNSGCYPHPATNPQWTYKFKPAQTRWHTARVTSSVLHQGNHFDLFSTSPFLNRQDAAGRHEVRVLIGCLVQTLTFSELREPRPRSISVSRLRESLWGTRDSTSVTKRPATLDRDSQARLCKYENCMRFVRTYVNFQAVCPPVPGEMNPEHQGIYANHIAALLRG